jgi:glutamyl-tRNA reductase
VPVRRFKKEVYLYESYHAADALEQKRGACAGALPEAGQLIATAAPILVAEADLQAADPVITRFRAALKNLQASELERLYNRLPELDEHSRQVIWQFADCLVAKMLHPPLECLRDESRNGSPHRLLDALQRLFRLSE